MFGSSSGGRHPSGYEVDQQRHPQGDQGPVLLGIKTTTPGEMRPWSSRGLLPPQTTEAVVTMEADTVLVVETTMVMVVVMVMEKAVGLETATGIATRGTEE